MTLSDFPNELPAITLAFQNSKQLDPRINFSRASAASPDSSAEVNGEVMLFDPNVPRLSDNGLLIENANTNLAIYQDFATEWNDNDTTITAAGTSPEGTSVSLMTENTADDTHGTWSTDDMVEVGKTYTYSVFVKSNGRDYVRLTTFGELENGAVFDIINGIVLPPNATAGAVGYIEPYGDGWFRCAVTFTPQSIKRLAVYMQIDPNDPSNSNAIYQGDGVSGIYIKNVQLEEGSFPTSFIPTNGAEVTRAADLCEITGDDFSSWYNQSETTLVIHQSINQAGGTNGDPWRLYGNGSLRGQVGDGVPFNGLIYMDFQFPTFTGYLEGYLPGNNWQVGQQNKAAFSWYIPPDSNPLTAQTEASGSLNGQSTVTTNNLAPIGDRTSFRPLSSNSGTIRYISFYSTKVSDAALEALTT